MNLNLHKLRVFQEVMRTGSISLAAINLGRTQPAVSLSIANLEQEAELVLFERSQGRLIPTPEAYFLLGQTSTILEQADNLSRTIDELGKLKQGRLSIAFLPVSSQHFIPDLVARFLSDKPDVNVSLFSRTTNVIHENIASQQFDIGLSETVPEHPAVKATNYDLPCVCALRADDPLSTKMRINAKDLCGKPMATLQEGSASLISTRRAFEKEGAELIQRFELRTFQTGIKLIEAGLCYSIVDAITALSYSKTTYGHGPLIFRSFDPGISLPISVLEPALRPPSKIVNAFKDLLCKEIERVIENDWSKKAS